MASVVEPTSAGRETRATAGREAGATGGRETGATGGREAGATGGREAGATGGREAGATGGREAGATSLATCEKSRLRLLAHAYLIRTRHAARSLLLSYRFPLPG